MVRTGLPAAMLAMAAGSVWAGAACAAPDSAEVVVNANGAPYVRVAAIINRLKCDLYDASVAAKNDGRELVKASGSLTLATEVTNDLTGALGVAVEAGTFGGEINGNFEQSAARSRTISIPFVADKFSPPKGDCKVLPVKKLLPTGALSDESLLKYVSFKQLQGEVGEGGAVFALDAIKYEGKFAVARTGGGDAKVTLVVFSAKGGKSQENENSQGFDVTLAFKPGSGTILKTP